jgi:hypothetical protein
MQMQTEGFVALGDLPNDEHYPCLICRKVPERVMVDLFIPEPSDIPSAVQWPTSKTLVMPYRLCPQCHNAKPAPWKIRLLILERLNKLIRCVR